MIEYWPYSMNYSLCPSNMSCTKLMWSCSSLNIILNNIEGCLYHNALHHLTNSNRPHSQRFVQSNDMTSQKWRGNIWRKQCSIQSPGKQRNCTTKFIRNWRKGGAQSLLSTSINSKWFNSTHCTESSSMNHCSIQGIRHNWVDCRSIHWW